MGRVVVDASSRSGGRGHAKRRSEAEHPPPNALSELEGGGEARVPDAEAPLVARDGAQIAAGGLRAAILERLSPHREKGLLDQVICIIFIIGKVIGKCF